MKSHICNSIILMLLFSTNAQEKKRDTLAVVEVVNILTKYNPKIATVKKIEKNPTNTLLEKNNKVKLKYAIFSAPVASTFIPQTGALKALEIGIKEKVYTNYLATGYGNYKSPYAELYISKNTRFSNVFGLHATYNAANKNISKTILNSTFSDFSARSYYTQKEGFFDWKIQADLQSKHYNWYGLPQDRNFTETVVNGIEEAQNYQYLALTGNFNFYDSYVKTGNVSVRYLTDTYKSSEVLLHFNIDSSFPIPFFRNTTDEISINGGLEFLKGSFENNYQTAKAVNYQQNTLHIHPQYETDYHDISIKAGLQTFLSVDSENKLTNFFMFPEVLLQTDLYKKYIRGKIGFTGNLQTNTYQQFSEENPFVSPTLFITQTAETSNLYLAFNGSISRELSYNFKVSIKQEEDKPLFLRNKSKSDGTASAVNDNLKGYEYGNSFAIYYDDIKTSSIFAEIEYQYTQPLRLSVQIKYDHYATTNALENWNLPSVKGTFLANYTTQKWDTNITAFYVSERRDALYNSPSNSFPPAIARLNSFIDLNMYTGYHISNQFSAFLKLNNLLNTKYQRFANFDTQGFQISGGITYKFDL
ncbi:TonB-dependent receptor [Polaribacter irgensii]|nr:TonB-dependent receptor [Polaribacter irgensii]